MASGNVTSPSPRDPLLFPSFTLSKANDGLTTTPANGDPRLPAQHYQTKNGGKNHGRWFYTCQHPQPKRCDFFLWDDEAKAREAAAVLNNSRTEPGSSAPVTPSKPISSTGLATPQTGSRYKGWNAEDVRTPYTTPSKVTDAAGTLAHRNETQATAATTTDGSEEEYFDWPASDEEDLGKAAEAASHDQTSGQEKNMRPPPETPRKAAKTEALSSPGKRRYEEVDTTGDKKEYPTPPTGLDSDDPFATPATTKRASTGLFANNAFGQESPVETPTPIRYNNLPSGSDSELASEILTTLTAHAIALPADARDAIKGICNRHVLYTRGVMKGRDVSRAMVKAKDQKVVEMQAEIEGLKSERETNRVVIRHLRRDIAERKEASQVKGRERPWSS